MKALLFLVVIGLGACLVFEACNGVPKDTQQQVNAGAQNAWNATKQTAQKIGNAAQKDYEQSAETLKVKGPIDQSKDVDSSNLAVETIGKTVIISGTVPTQAQKDKVQQMAEANADQGYKIENNLKVAPKPKDSSPPITDDQKQANGGSL